MISETEARSKWRHLFGKGRVTPKTIQNARQLVREIQPESPLRSRLSEELEEIRSIHSPRRKK